MRIVCQQTIPMNINPYLLFLKKKTAKFKIRSVKLALILLQQKTVKLAAIFLQ